jgi:uncharacterized membrane protein YoaK (UPF0700 family)
VSSILADIRGTIVPDRHGKHGPLPPLLVSLTLVTGLVDAFSYLALGHIFVANMTGNVVFLGFALAGAAGFSITSSLIALASFGLGRLWAGVLVHDMGATGDGCSSLRRAAKPCFLAHR